VSIYNDVIFIHFKDIEMIVFVPYTFSITDDILLVGILFEVLFKTLIVFTTNKEQDKTTIKQNKMAKFTNTRFYPYYKYCCSI